MTVNHHVLPFPNFRDLVQLEVLVLGLGDFWTVLAFIAHLEPLPLTHVITHICHTSIYVPTCLSHVHTCISDCLGWLGSSSVHLGGFDGQILRWHLYATRWLPKHHYFSLLQYIFDPDIVTCWTFIIIYVIDLMCVCKFHSFSYFMHILWTISNCESLLGS